MKYKEIKNTNEIQKFKIDIITNMYIIVCTMYINKNFNVKSSNNEFLLSEIKLKKIIASISITSFTK